MKATVEFLGPVVFYVRRKGGSWIAWADPFTVAGEGRSRAAAIRDAQNNVEVLLECVAKEILTSKQPVQVFCPLDDSYKKKAKVEKYLLYSVTKLVKKRPRSAPTKLSRKRVVDALKHSVELGFVPVPLTA